MAKKFLGFNPEQKFTILSKMGYEGPKDPNMMEAYAASNPAAASRLSDYSRRAQELLNGPQMFAGGLLSGSFLSRGSQTTPEGTTTTTPTTSNTPTPAPVPATLDEAQAQAAEALRAYNADPTNEAAGVSLAQANSALTAAQRAFNLTEVPSGAEAISQAVQTPTSLLEQATAAKVEQTPDQFVDASAGQTGPVSTVTPATVSGTAQAVAPDKIDAATADATKVTEGVRGELESLQAATAEPSKAATVQGQLEGLMAQFEGGATPPWASGAMRQAMGILQQRGLGASSVAGQAVVQAAMESAIAIASQDASTVAQFEMQNLNNRQQTAIFKTQQLVASMFTDQAAENAAKQFNAASENQVNQFFAGLQESVSRFNADQINGIMQFNAGQENAVEQFNSNLQAQRDQFNAQNSLLVAQANALWRQNIATLDTAAENEAIMTNVKTANALTGEALNQIWQRERDLMAFAFQASQNQAERDTNLLLADKQITATTQIERDRAKAADTAAKWSLATSLIGGLF
jgi:hypothetical protein